MSLYITNVRSETQPCRAHSTVCAESLPAKHRRNLNPTGPKLQVQHAISKHGADETPTLPQRPDLGQGRQILFLRHQSTKPSEYPARKNGRRIRWFHRAQLLGRHPLTPRSPDREITLALPSIDAITGKHKDMREVHRILTAMLATVFTRYFTNGCNLEDNINGSRIQVQPSNR